MIAQIQIEQGFDPQTFGFDALPTAAPGEIEQCNQSGYLKSVPTKKRQGMYSAPAAVDNVVEQHDGLRTIERTFNETAASVLFSLFADEPAAEMWICGRGYDGTYQRIGPVSIAGHLINFLCLQALAQHTAYFSKELPVEHRNPRIQEPSDGTPTRVGKHLVFAAHECPLVESAAEIYEFGIFRRFG